MKKLIFLALMFLPILSATSTYDSYISNDFKTKMRNSAILEQEANFVRDAILFIIDDRDYIHEVIYDVDNEHLVHMEKSRKLFGIPSEIFYRILFKESTFQFDALSHVGAYGYMQIMPTTLDWINSRLPFELQYDNPLDNIFAGSYYLKWNKLRMDKKYPELPEEIRWIMVLASYNAGPGVYRKAMDKYAETMDYIDFIMQKYNKPIYDNLSYQVG